jgi:hypothetical protein
MQRCGLRWPAGPGGPAPRAYWPVAGRFQGYLDGPLFPPTVVIRFTPLWRLALRLKGPHTSASIPAWARIFSNNSSTYIYSMGTQHRQRDPCPWRCPARTPADCRLEASPAQVTPALIDPGCLKQALNLLSPHWYRIFRPCCEFFLLRIMYIKPPMCLSSSGHAQCVYSYL